jgi:phosphohistidine phosphatase
LVHVCLVQHGEAVSEEIDPRRPLSERGRTEAEKVASFLAKAGIKVSRILHSTKLRAKETAEIMAKHLGAKVEEVEGLEPKADPRPWAEKLKDVKEDVMIVGHLPHLSKLASLLLVGRDDVEIIRFRYAGVYCLERGEDGSWRILWAIRPDIIPG